MPDVLIEPFLWPHKSIFKLFISTYLITFLLSTPPTGEGGPHYALLSSPLLGSRECLLILRNAKGPRDGTNAAIVVDSKDKDGERTRGDSNPRLAA